MLTKTTCTRCGGSGKFSFNLIRGTVCFGCEGSGFKMVDLKKLEARKIAANKRDAAKQSQREAMIAALNEVVSEMNALFGPFDVTTELGLDNLNRAVADKFSKSIYVIRNERLSA